MNSLSDKNYTDVNFLSMFLIFIPFGCIQGVLDITTTEVADHIVGGIMACDETRFDAAIDKNIPLVLSVGALDMVNFGAHDTIPSAFAERKIHVHNEQVRQSITVQFWSSFFFLN
jgi:uncharacterized protein (UPF0261 family)